MGIDLHKRLALQVFAWVKFCLAQVLGEVRVIQLPLEFFVALLGLQELSVGDALELLGGLRVLSL